MLPEFNSGAPPPPAGLVGELLLPPHDSANDTAITPAATNANTTRFDMRASPNS
jgi:hypothetical protein